MQKLVNLTPHSVRIIGVDGKLRTIYASGTRAWVMPRQIPARSWAGIQMVKVEVGEVAGLPDPQPDTIFIVSAAVRAAAPTRTDLATPASYSRDANGNITAYYNLEISDGNSANSKELTALDARIEACRRLIDGLTAKAAPAKVSKPTIDSEWLTGAQVMRYFDIPFTQTYFYRLIKLGKLPAHRRGNKFMFKASEIQQFLNNRKK